VLTPQARIPVCTRRRSTPINASSAIKKLYLEASCNRKSSSYNIMYLLGYHSIVLEIYGFKIA